MSLTQFESAYTLTTATRLRGKTDKRHCDEMLLDNKNNKKKYFLYRAAHTQPTQPAMGMGWMQKEKERKTTPTFIRLATFTIMYLIIFPLFFSSAHAPFILAGR